MEIEAPKTVISIEGWKGKSDVSIVDINKNFLILRRWHKHKETKENYFQDVEVKIEDIEFLYNLLRESCEIGREYGSHFIWRKIIETKKLNETEGVSVDYMVEHFLGYRQKKKGRDYIFKYYYNPLSVLEARGYLHVFGRGGCMLITKEDFVI